MVKKTKAPGPNGSRRKGASRRVKLRLASEVSLIPTMFLGCVVVGYYLGGWVGQFLPGDADKWSGFGVLYGLAAALYYTYKIIRRIVQQAGDASPKSKAGDLKDQDRDAEASSDLKTED